MTEETERSTRQGLARERQRKRKERHIKQHTTASPRQTSAQLSPMEGFKVANLRIPLGILRPLGLLLLSILLIIGIFYGLRSINPPEASPRPNAIWLGTNWSYDLPSDEQVLGLVERLRRNKIGTAYVWVTYLKDDLAWSGKVADRDPLTNEAWNNINAITEQPYTNTLAEMEPNILRFVQQYKTFYPEGKLYGWISYPTNLDEDGYTLDNTTLHTRIAELATLLVTSYGFDGIYLNIEPITDNDQNLLALLRTVRQSIGTEIPIALAIPPDWRPSGDPIPYSPNITATFEWTKSYKQTVALLVDEMLVMAYHSGLVSSTDYSTWVAYQVRAYAEAVAELGIETTVKVGIPTYPAELPAHDPAVENVETALIGIKQGLAEADTLASSISGVTIYAEWTTDESEWELFHQLWANATE
ncbi:MAG: hypothetical protein ACOYLB_04380 [Phototrophicaceae bacterium]